MEPVGSHVPILGSYSSVVVHAEPQPPVTRTLPLGSSVAVWPARGVVILPVAIHVVGVAVEVLVGVSVTVLVGVSDAIRRDVAGAAWPTEAALTDVVEPATTLDPVGLSTPRTKITTETGSQPR